MAEKEKKETKREPAKGGKRMHLHEIRSVQAHDGSIVHHHYYKAKKEDPHISMVKENAATSDGPPDAGAHVEDQFAMNQMGQGEPQGGAPEAAEGAEPQGGEPEPAQA